MLLPFVYLGPGYSCSSNSECQGDQMECKMKYAHCGCKQGYRDEMILDRHTNTTIRKCIGEKKEPLRSVTSLSRDDRRKKSLL